MEPPSGGELDHGDRAHGARFGAAEQRFVGRAGAHVGSRAVVHRVRVGGSLGAVGRSAAGGRVDLDAGTVHGACGGSDGGGAVVVTTAARARWSAAEVARDPAASMSLTDLTAATAPSNGPAAAGADDFSGLLNEGTKKLEQGTFRGR